MKLNCYHDTDSLYIDLSERPSADSRDISAGVVLDHDENGTLVGIDIDHASKNVELRHLVLSGMSAEVERLAV